MKSFKYFFILISLFGVLTANLGAMDVKDVEVIIVNETKSPFTLEAINTRLADIENETKSPFTLEAINTRLVDIEINGGFLRLEEAQETDIPGYTISLYFVKKNKSPKKVGYVRYIVYLNDPEMTDGTHIEFVSVDKEYQKRGLAALLSLAGLHRGLQKSHNHPQAIVEAVHDATKKIFSTLGFKQAGTLGVYNTNGLGDLLENNGKAMLERSFEKLEYSAQCCCFKLFSSCCSKKIKKVIR